MPVCSVGRDASTDDICADAAVAPMQARVPRRDDSPSQVCFASAMAKSEYLNKKLSIALYKIYFHRKIYVYMNQSIQYQPALLLFKILLKLVRLFGILWLMFRLALSQPQITSLT